MKIVIGLVFLLGGLVCLLGAVFHWDWLFRSRRSRLLVESIHMEQGKVTYGVIGIVLILIALIVMLVPQVSQTLTGRPDATAILTVEADGCSVTRSDVTGMTDLKNLLWRVTTRSYDEVATRTAYEEYTYRYPHAGEYFVVLQAWYNSSYVTISNRVAITCSN
jgi:hypothetical protein